MPTLNPYIGPRAFEEGEAARFFGRERELEDLFHLLLARRLVLLHAPSGAGKSSLIQAALIPRLRAEGFMVHPVIRVGAEAAAGIGGNRFTTATLLSLDEEHTPAMRLPASELGQFTLGAYQAQRQPAATEEVFIFDQFEEVLSADAADRAAKERFFAELGAFLEDARCWGLFALREDYLGALKPLLLPIPTRLAATFRLDLLGPEQARRAMQGPAQAVGVAFDATAAQRLVDDLRRAVVQRPDGTSETVLGQAIEPVQLQVVCFRLWERTQAETGAPTVITAADIESAGDVEAALRSYYAERVAATATATAVSERWIRDWVEGKLITETGLRGQVMREPEATGGLANATIRGLVDAHLVRAEERRGATWYELAHDRLVAPIRTDNAAWYEQNLSVLQRQADLWERQSRPDGLLLRGAALNDAIDWARVHQAEMTALEHEYMREALALREQQRREERANRRVRRFAWIAALGGAVALALAVVAWLLYGQSNRALSDADEARRTAQTQEALAHGSAADAQQALTTAQTAQAEAEAERVRAEAQLRVAQAQRLAAQAQLLSERVPDRAQLLAVEALRASDPPVPAAIQALHDVLGTPLGQLVGGRPIVTGTLTLSDRGRYLAVAGNDKVLRVYDLARATQEVTPTNAPPDTRAVAFSHDGETLAAAGSDGRLRVWRTAALKSMPSTLETDGAAVGALIFSPDGTRLAAGCADGTVRLWATGSYTAATSVLQTSSAAVTALGFSPDGSRLAAGDASGEVFVWEDLGADQAVATTIRLGAPIEKVIINSSGDVAALGGHRAAVWDVDSRTASDIGGETLDIGLDESGSLRRSWREPRSDFIALDKDIMEGRFNEIIIQAISRRATRVAGARRDGAILLRTTQPGATMRASQGRAIRQLAFSDDENWLVAQGEDGITRVWNMTAGASTEPAVVRANDYVRSLAFRPDGTLVFAAGYLSTWPPDGNEKPPGVFLGYWASPDGHYIAGRRATNFNLYLMDVDRKVVTEFAVASIINPMTPAVFSPSGDRLALVDGASVRVWGTATPDAQSLDFQADKRTRALAWSPDGTLLAAGSGNGSIWIWSLVADATPVASRVVGMPVSALAFSPDGAWLAVAGAAEVHLYATSDLAAAPRRLEYTGSVPSLARFSPDGAWLAVGGEGRVLLWHMERAEDSPIIIEGYEGNPAALAFSLDSSRLAVGGMDGTVLLYRTSHLDEEPVELQGYPRRIYAVSFSPDGRYLAAGGRDTSARVWRVQTSELVALACTTAGRSLTPDEWATYMGVGTPYRLTCP